MNYCFTFYQLDKCTLLLYLIVQNNKKIQSFKFPVYYLWKLIRNKFQSGISILICAKLYYISHISRMKVFEIAEIIFSIFFFLWIGKKIQKQMCFFSYIFILKNFLSDLFFNFRPLQFFVESKIRLRNI